MATTPSELSVDGFGKLAEQKKRRPGGQMRSRTGILPEKFFGYSWGFPFDVDVPSERFLGQVTMGKKNEKLIFHSYSPQQIQAISDARQSQDKPCCIADLISDGMDPIMWARLEEIMELFLDEKDLQVVGLFLEGLSFRKIGDVMGISRKAASSRYKKVVRLLRHGPERRASVSAQHEFTSVSAP